MGKIQTVLIQKIAEKTDPSGKKNYISKLKLNSGISPQYQDLFKELEKLTQKYYPL